MGSMDLPPILWEQPDHTLFGLLILIRRRFLGVFTLIGFILDESVTYNQLVSYQKKYDTPDLCFKGRTKECSCIIAYQAHDRKQIKPARKPPHTHAHSALHAVQCMQKLLSVVY